MHVASQTNVLEFVKSIKKYASLERPDAATVKAGKPGLELTVST